MAVFVFELCSGGETLYDSEDTAFCNLKIHVDSKENRGDRFEPKSILGNDHKLKN